MELYKKYRPRKLSEMIGNASTVAILEGMLQEGRLPHTVLFSGPSGCGKTSLARILASSLGVRGLDLHEVNSSSYRGIDSIREIEELMHLSATSGPHRMWIMDEVHKLSNDAQNAFLKALEDTPTSVYFVLCTTDAQKLIAPLRNRCTQFIVEALSHAELTKLCKRVLRKEGATVIDEAVDEVCGSVGGSARLALVLLAKVMRLPKAKQVDAVRSGVEEENVAIDLCRALIKKSNWHSVASILKGLKADPEQVRWAVLGYAKAVLQSGKVDQQAYILIDIFKTPFYESKDAGLTAACFEAIHGSG